MTYTFDQLTVNQYHQFLLEGDKLTPGRAAEILTGKKKSQLTLKEVESIRLGDLTPPEAVQWSKILVHDGELYGQVTMASLSFGEFVDLLEYAKDFNKNLVEIVALLYRPIKEFGLKDRVKLQLASYLANKGVAQGKMIRLMDSLEYELEEYDPIKCDLRLGTIKKFPAHTAHWAMTFFLNFSQQLRVDFLKSLTQDLKQNLPKSKKKTS